MAAPATMTATLSPQEGAFALARIACGSNRPAAAAAGATAAAAGATSLRATHTAETAAATAALDASATAAASAALDAHVASEAVSSTLMGIALLAYLQGSGAKHETSGGGAGEGGGYGSSTAPSSSQQGGVAAAARPAAAARATGAHTPSHEQSRPRRYQRMSPADADAPTVPLIWTLAAIKATQSKAQYTCKRVLSSSTYLHRVHVNAAMSSNLLPDYGGSSGNGGGKSSLRGDEDSRNPAGAPTCRKPNTVIFRRRVRMLDEQDREWLVTYESLCSAGQRHTRFSAGWAALCKANDFKVGETIVFSRWGKRDGGVVVVARDYGAV